MPSRRATTNSKTSLEARAEFLEADRAISGCIATIREDGELRLIKGLVHPEDMPQRKSAVDGTEADEWRRRLRHP